MTEYHSKDNGDDLHAAIRNNPGAISEFFSESAIVNIEAEVCGENEGYDWWWVVSLQNGKHALLTGGCDYTGWDCRSELSCCGVFDTPLQAAQESPDGSGNYERRNIRRNLIAQLLGEQPFALYIAE